MPAGFHWPSGYKSVSNQRRIEASLVSNVWIWDLVTYSKTFHLIRGGMMVQNCDQDIITHECAPKFAQHLFHQYLGHLYKIHNVYDPVLDLHLAAFCVCTYFYINCNQ